MFAQQLTPQVNRVGEDVMLHLLTEMEHARTRLLLFVITSEDVMGFDFCICVLHVGEDVSIIRHCRFVSHPQAPVGEIYGAPSRELAAISHPEAAGKDRTG